MRDIIQQNIAISSGVFEKEKDYWLEKLSGELTISGFPLDHARPLVYSAGRESVSGQFTDDIYRGMLHISNGSEYGIYMILLTGLYYLLYKYTGNEDVIIGTPVFKQEKGSEDTYFNHIMALRVNINGGMNFKDLLLNVSNTLHGANENMNYPFEKIVKLLDIPICDNRSPLFDTMIVFKNIHDQNVIKGQKSDIIFYFDMSNEQLSYEINYNSSLFNKTMMKRLGNHLMNYFKVTVQNPKISLADIEVLSEEEIRQILVDFNSTEVAYPKEKTIHQMIEEQVEKTPEHIALSFEDRYMTYRELNEKANQVARMLVEHGVKDGSKVSILMPRSIEMVIGMIGVLKANAVCIPLDIEHPEERINTILEDSGSKVLLKPAGLSHVHNFDGIELSLDEQIMKSYGKENLLNENKSDNLAYIIYTSGSTGKPKGAMLHHYGITNHVLTKISVLGITEDDVVGNNFSSNVIAAVWQILAPLFVGAKLVVYPENVEKDPYEQFRRVACDSISVIEVIPSALSTYISLIESGKEKIKMPKLRKIALTSEETKSILVNKFYRNYTIQLVDCYGQTECSDDTLHYEIPVSTETTLVKIGKPSNNTKVYVLDKNKRLQPVGVAGELCVSGDGLALGYLNRPELTKEKFIPNPFIPGKRIYRTGDLARWLPDGSVEYLGRIDHQVKIRGYRIELGEIEYNLLKHPKIKQVAVKALADKSGDSYLCAYIVADEILIVPALREYLSKELPVYMLPSYFVQLKEMPLTPNGKIDRKVLPEPDGSINTGVDYVAPGDDIEEKLTNLCREILNVAQVGMNHDFFELGGHSLKATELLFRIHKEFNVKIELEKIFKTSTIREIANCIKEKKASSFSSILPVNEAGYSFNQVYPAGCYPSSSSQKRLYILRQLEGAGVSYNMPRIVMVEGYVNKERLKNVFKALVKRHEAIRTSFELLNGELVQRIHEDVDFDMSFISLENQLDGLNEEDKKTRIRGLVDEFVQPFELSKAPLFRVRLVKLSADRYMLMWDMHHIISDGKTMAVLEREFNKLYNGEELPELKIQYKDYAAWQHEMLKAETMRKQEEYWINRFSTVHGLEGQFKIPVLDIPSDFPRPSTRTFEGDTIHFEIEKELAGKVKILATEQGLTLYMVLLAAFNVLLFKYTGQEDIVIGSPVAARTHPDLENVAGIFFNTLPMRNFPKGDKTFNEFLKEVRQNSLEAYKNQDYPLEELVSKMNISIDSSRNPLFDVVFILQNVDNSEINSVGDLKFTPYTFESKTSKHDLQLEASEIGDKIQFLLVYSTRLFKTETVDRLIKYFIKILGDIATEPDKKLKDIGNLSTEIKNQVLIDFNEPL